MLDRIKQAHNEGRILPDIKVNYDSVSTISPIQIIHQIYPDFKKVTKGDMIGYSVLDTKINVDKLIKIEFTKDFNPDYYIVRSSTHDGTLYFTHELYRDMIANIINGSAYCKNNNPHNYSKDFWDYDIHYTLGNIYHFMDFGKKDINGHMIHGQTDVMVMPVKIEYIKNNDGVYQHY